MRSTSSSRWNAEASRLSSFSRSASEIAGVLDGGLDGEDGTDIRPVEILYRYLLRLHSVRQSWN